MENKLIQNDLEEVRKEFRIENLESATWAFRKLRAISAKEADIKAIASQEISRINAWMENELKQYEDDRDYFEGLLSQYYRTEKEKDKRFKLSTPFGKVTSKETDKWNYEDEEALLNYLKTSEPKCVRVKEEVNKTELKKIYKNGVNEETGEILPFVKITRELSITVKAE